MAETLNYVKPVTTGQDNPYIFGGTVETGSGQSLKKVYLTTSITDISTAGQIYVVSPVAGTISKIYSVINGTIATADAVLTPKLGGTAITDGAITVAYNGSAAGDVDSSTPSALNSITAGAAIEIETNGASTNTVEVVLTIEITLS